MLINRILLLLFCLQKKTNHYLQIKKKISLLILEIANVFFSLFSCRLTPLFAFSMFYIASIYVHTGNGPLWKIAIYPEAIYCQKNWWLNLIYLSNYINTDEMVGGLSLKYLE